MPCWVHLLPVVPGKPSHGFAQKRKRLLNAFQSQGHESSDAGGCFFLKDWLRGLVGFWSKPASPGLAFCLVRFRVAALRFGCVEVHGSEGAAAFFLRVAIWL